MRKISVFLVQVARQKAQSCIFYLFESGISMESLSLSRKKMFITAQCIIIWYTVHQICTSWWSFILHLISYLQYFIITCLHLCNMTVTYLDGLSEFLHFYLFWLTFWLSPHIHVLPDKHSVILSMLSFFDWMYHSLFKCFLFVPLLFLS
jgi:hypothetical protein